jgi:hypothetical protein
MEHNVTATMAHITVVIEGAQEAIAGEVFREAVAGLGVAGADVEERKGLLSERK